MRPIVFINGRLRRDSENIQIIKLSAPPLDWFKFNGEHISMPRVLLHDKRSTMIPKPITALSIITRKSGRSVYYFTVNFEPYPHQLLALPE